MDMKVTNSANNSSPMPDNITVKYKRNLQAITYILGAGETTYR